MAGESLRDSAFDTILRFTGHQNVIAIPRVFVDLLGGDYAAAALLNQILYWTDRTRDPDGWFYKSYDEWAEEIGLSKYQVMRAMNGDKRAKNKTTRLADIGIQTKVKHTLQGKPTVHYRVDRVVFMTALTDYIRNSKQNASLKVNNVDEPKSTLSTLDSQQSQRTYTETTTEITAEIKEIPAPIVADEPPTPEPTIIEENTPALPEGSGKILAFTSQTETDEDTPRRKPRKSAPVHDALIAAFGLSNQKMTRSADSVYWKAATELQDFPADRVDELYRYVKRKASAEQWRGFTVNALAKYAPEFLRDNPYKIEYIVDDSALPKAAGAEGDAIPISADKKVEAERLMSELLAKMNGNGVKRGSTNGR